MLIQDRAVVQSLKLYNTRRSLTSWPGGSNTVGRRHLFKSIRCNLQSIESLRATESIGHGISFSGITRPGGVAAPAESGDRLECGIVRVACAPWTCSALAFHSTLHSPDSVSP